MLQIRCGSSYELLAVLKTVRPLLSEMQVGLSWHLCAYFFW